MRFNQILLINLFLNNKYCHPRKNKNKLKSFDHKNDRFKNLKLNILIEA